MTTDTGSHEHGAGSLHTTAAAKARAKSRNFADVRLQIYGIIAITIAAFALVALLYNVFQRASGVLTEHYVSLDVNIADDENDFLSLAKKEIRAQFPLITDRRDRRAVTGLISDGASDDMRAEAEAGTLQRGEAVPRKFLLSDDADLYLRGDYGDLEEIEIFGVLSSIERGKEVELFTGANDFKTAVEKIKSQLGRQVAQLRNQVSRQENAIRVTNKSLEGLTGDARIDLERQLEVFEVKRGQLSNQADKLKSVIDTPVATNDALKLTRLMPSYFVHANGGILKLTEVSNDHAMAKPIIPMQNYAELAPSAWSLHVLPTPEGGRKISDLQVGLLEQLKSEGRIESATNWRFLSTGDSTQPEIAGIKGAIVGSLWTMLVTFLLAFPVGVCAAIYLEEFAPKTRVTNFIDVNINNLAAVPSIVFGLLGLAVFINFFGVPRSSPLAGGMVLALMTLPTVIIASRASIRAVPPSIRAAALGLGASKVQTVFHHVLPLAMPGILTGTIIGMAQALGETAPLLMIGMVAFITQIPQGITEPASVLPVQVFSWANNSERAFDLRTAAAIVTLLVFLILMNALAVILRKRFERRW